MTARNAAIRAAGWGGATGLLALPMGGMAVALWTACSAASWCVLASVLGAVPSPKRMLASAVPEHWRLTGSRIVGSRRAGTFAWFAAAIGACVLPALLGRAETNLAADVLLYIILALGLNVTVGEAGLFDLGYVAFYAVGAYAYAILSREGDAIVAWLGCASPSAEGMLTALRAQGIGFWAALPVAGLVAAAVAALVGLPVLRLRGDYLAIAMLGFQQIVQRFLENEGALTGGPSGIDAPRPAFGSFTFRTRSDHYYLRLAVVAILILLLRRILSSRIGRAWRAIRDDELAARSMGIDVRRARMLAFMIGAFCAGVAGVLFAAKQNRITPSSFGWQESIIVLSMVILGGRRSLAGVILGAALLTVLPEALREVLRGALREGFEDYRMLIYGALLVCMMALRPQGLAGRREACG
ncbi:MAG: branched-chain amino acid ABC transporter permease [Planctomycetes bacterium]|nr:branched-chain amino acid ABC transporter permease [Planctomycetota bacterium]